MYFIKKLFFWSMLTGAMYILLSYHFIFSGISDVHLLKKSKLTLEYTFYNIGGKTNTTILSKEPLREDGIGDLLADMGRMSETEWDRIMKKFEPEDDEDEW